MSLELIRTLQLGKAPRVIGTIITADYLSRWSEQPEPLPCDLVELRVDGFSTFPNWIDIGHQIERAGNPVIATIRHADEGGQWTGDEQAREPLLQSALLSLAGIDVELDAAIAERLAVSAREQKKLCILSYHNFENTPPVADLERMIQRMQALGAIAKIAATANSPDDVATLRSLLRFRENGPVCIIGMGSHGRETRLTFPLEGSCLTYGYLDTPGAPGQFSARELRAHFDARP